MKLRLVKGSCNEIDRRGEIEKRKGLERLLAPSDVSATSYDLWKGTIIDASGSPLNLAKITRAWCKLGGLPFLKVAKDGDG